MKRQKQLRGGTYVRNVPYVVVYVEIINIALHEKGWAELWSNRKRLNGK